MTVIGLTGGIASGKSLIARHLELEGIPCISTDKVWHRVLENPRHPAITSLVDHFGPEILTDQGSIDRKILAEIVFNDPAAKKYLEVLSHPIIHAQVMELISIASSLGHPAVAVELPILIDSDIPEYIDKVVVVDCTREQQITRLMQRNNLDRDTAIQRVDAQAPREARLALADYVVDSTGSKTCLTNQITGLIAYIKG